MWYSYSCNPGLSGPESEAPQTEQKQRDAMDKEHFPATSPETGGGEPEQKKPESSAVFDEYRLFYENAPTAYIVLFENLDIKHVNRSAAALLTSEEEQISGRSFTDFIEPEWVSVFYEAVEKSIQSMEKQTVDVKLKKTDSPSLQIRSEIIAQPDTENTGHDLYMSMTDITEQKHLEDVLRLNETMLSHGLEPMAVIDADYTYTLVNQGYEMLWGCPKERILGSKVAHIIGEELFNTTVKAKIDACMQEQVPIRYHKWIKSPALGDRYMEINYYPHRAEDGTITGVIHISRDITENKLAKGSLTETENQFLDILSWTSGAVYQFTLLKDGSAAVRFVNEKAGELFNRSLHDLKTCNTLFPSIHPSDYDTMWSTMKEAARNGHPWIHELRILAGSAETKYIRCFFKPHTQKNGNSNFTGLLMDITHQKLQEKQLQEQKEKYRNLFESIRDAIVVFTPERSIIDCNPAFTELFGYQPKDILNRDPGIICPDSKAYRQLETILKIPFPGQPSLKTVDYRKKHGSVFPGETSTFPLKNREGETIGFVLLIRDITERRISEKRLKEQKETLKVFIETLPQPAMLMEPDGKLILANPAAGRIFGKEGTPLGGKNINDFLPEKIAKFRLQNIEHAIFHKSPVRFKDFYNGIYFDNFVHPISDASGIVKQVAILCVNITELKLSEREQKRAGEFLEEQIQARTAELEDMNEAMRILLKKNEADKKEMKNRLRTDYDSLILPLLHNLKSSPAGFGQQNIAETLEQELEALIAPFTPEWSDPTDNLTPKEIQVASMIRQGFSNKEIADALNNSVRTITNHRERIRAKLNLKNSRINLRSFLADP